MLPASFLASCDRRTNSSATPAGLTHVVRGKIEGLPVAGKPGAQFYVHHEAIPGWARPDGTKGMNAMVMAFPLATGVALDGLAVGDIIELTVVQYPGSRVPYQTTGIKKLPAETALQFGSTPPKTLD